MRRFSPVLALLLIASALSAQPERVDRGPAHVEISTGDVLIRTTGNRILVLVDTVLDKSVAPDGIIDQWFALETAEPPAPIFAHLENALIVHSPAALRITTTETRYELVLRDAPREAQTPDGITTRVSGIGLSHNMGPTTLTIAQQLDRRGNVSTECDECGPSDPDPGGSGTGGAACNSGGPGSTSCSVTSGNNSCSVTCAAGYYACCNGIAGSTYCRCVRG